MENMATLDTIEETLDSIKQLTDEGIEYWYAKDLMPLLGYGINWHNFKKVIHKAKQACESSSIDPSEHFNDVVKTLKRVNQYGEHLGTTNDTQLTRYACYLTAQNADPSKIEVGLAQTYFATQTFKQEEFERLNIDGRRIFVRSKVLDQNKKLASSAKRSGVKNFGLFHDAGYRGLYNMGIRDIAKIKGLAKDKLLDRAGETELAANLFRITQTDEQLKQKIDAGIKIGEETANSLHKTVGTKIRSAIRDIGGTMPENLPAEEHIKTVQKRFDESKKKLKLTTNEKPLKIDADDFDDALDQLLN